MAKTNGTRFEEPPLPDMGDGESVDEMPDSPPPPAAVAKKPPAAKPLALTLRLTLFAREEGDVRSLPRQFNVPRVSGQTAVMVDAVRRMTESSGFRTNLGGAAASPPQAVAWLVEEIARQNPEAFQALRARTIFRDCQPA